RLPVVAAGLPPGDPDLRLGRTAVPAEVVATARVPPGRRSDRPMVLVAADRLPEITREAGAAPVAEIWTNGGVGPAIDALMAAGAVALGYRRLAVDVLRPPPPLLQVPVPALVLSGVVVLAVAGLAALYAQRAADRADPATVLRQDV